MDINSLPQAYKDRLRGQLGEEFDDYLESLTQPPVTGLRVNGRKTDVPELVRLLRISDDRTAWCPEGLYPPDTMNPAAAPAYFAGLYYIQEPSAMAPAAYLPVKPGSRVLDLCAAPGGKSVQLYGKPGCRTLYANDISPSRGRALVKNLERAGAANIFVTAETPEHLRDVFPEHFDAVLVDAPCSGEGMIRKEPSILKDWATRGPAYYAAIQREILRSAAECTAPGGFLLYSTCTFSEEEDEGTVDAFLAEHPDFSLRELVPAGGAVRGKMPGTLKFWPHRVRGEGHFLALLRKKGGEDPAEEADGWDAAEGLAAENLRTAGGNAGSTRTASPRLSLSRLPDIAPALPDGEIFVNKGSHYLLPPGEKIIPQLRYLRTGLLLGEDKGKRFVPSQALAMALDENGCRHVLKLDPDDGRIIRYLKGESIAGEGTEDARDGSLILVLAGRWPLGFAKKNGSLLKNELNPGWRMM